jgi:dTDP-4-amino-4,6-dideoxygalactose transaminase
MQVRYLDLSVKDPDLKRDLLGAFERVLDHGRVVLGPEVDAFEAEVARYCGREFAVGVSSGSDALYVALRALDIGPGDEVITTPMSWVATVNAIALVGATPVFADIGADLNVDPDRIEEVITDRTRAIIPVHFTGRMCKMERICAIAASHGVDVIEDAAQSFGSKSKDGKPSGSFGRLACFSMNSMKVLHSYGEAGAVLTDDKDLKEKMESLRYAGTVNRQDCHYPSLNFRLQTIQAALLMVEVPRLDDIIARRREIARIYNERLFDVVECPIEDVSSVHTYYTYSIQADRRDELQEYLEGKGVETKIHHPYLMPHQTAYRGKFAPVIPVAERAVTRILSIPNQEILTDEEVDYVVDSIRSFYGAG